jgi:hypothetical protein
MRFFNVLKEANPLLRSAFPGGARLLSSHRPMKWDGIPHHAMLGNGSLDLIYCLSGRTARRSLAPPWRRFASFR